MTNSKVNYVVRGGLYTAISLILLYLAAFVPNSKLFFTAAASFIIPISIVTIGIKYSLIVYAAVSLTGLFLPVSKGIVLVYIIFFGLYGFIKHAAEKIKNLPLEIIIKLSFFNVTVFVSYIISKLFISYKLPSNIPWAVIIICLEIIFFIYDYILTLFIDYIFHKMSLLK